MGRLAALAVGAGAALPPLLLLLVWGASCGQDFDFHLQSWLAVHAAWSHGIFAPHWVAAANYGAGEPRFVFYPPLSWLLGALLGVALPWTAVPAAFTALCFGGAAAAMYSLGRRYAAGPQAACAALLYAFSPYLLFTGLERGALSELLAAMWMPFLLAALLEPALPVLRTALLVAALWYTNAPAAVMGCYLVLLALVWNASRAAAARRWQTAWHCITRGAASLALGCALAADYLLPAWYEQRWAAIERAIGSGMRVRDSFLFGRTGDAYHDQVLRAASWIGVATLAAGLCAGCLVLWLQSGDASGAKENTASAGSSARFLLGLLAVVLFLQLPWSLGVWHALPEMRFLQFPWRLLLPASAAAALLTALALPRLRLGGRAAIILLCLLYAAGISLWTVRTRYQPCDGEDRVSAQLALPGHGGFPGTDEYAPRGTDNGEIQQGLPLVRLLAAPDAGEGDDTTVANPQWQPDLQDSVPGVVAVLEHGPESLRFQVLPQANGWAVLRLERWPGWRVTRDGKPCGAACAVRDDGLLAVYAPAHRKTAVMVRYRATADVEAGRALSLLAVFGLAAAGFCSAMMRRR